MTPAHDSGSSGEHSQEHRPTDPTAPASLPQIPRTARLRTLRLALRHPRPARPSTVWPCAQDDLHEGTGVLANWLLTAVIKIVTTYTQPGQRVLLLAPSPFIALPASWSSAAIGNRPRRGPYDGLLEAAWTVVRLGRGIQTQTAGARPPQSADKLADGAAESESGPRLDSVGPDADGHSTLPSDRPAGPDATATGHSPDRFDLIITAVEPRTLDRLHPADWAGLLTPNGVVAVVTHSDRSGGRFTDAAGPLVRSAHYAGLRYLDRIALLRVPVRDGVLAAVHPAARDRAQTSPRRSTSVVRHAPVHDDLLVFTRQPALNGTTDGEETSDE